MVGSAEDWVDGDAPVEEVGNFPEWRQSSLYKRVMLR
jgi:hypothetical protein